MAILPPQRAWFYATAFPLVNGGSAVRRFTSIAVLLAVFCISACGGRAGAAEVRADRFDRSFNAAADLVGATVRLGPAKCDGHFCSYEGDRGLSARTIYDEDDKRRRIFDSGVDIPASFTQNDTATLFLAVITAFVPEVPFGARTNFALNLAHQFAVDRARAEGKLGGWVFVLRFYPGEKWRVIARKPDAG